MGRHSRCSCRNIRRCCHKFRQCLNTIHEPVPVGVGPVNGVVADIRIKIDASAKLDRIFVWKPTRARVVVSGTVLSGYVMLVNRFIRS
jgi:hypothetical protein